MPLVNTRTMFAQAYGQFAVGAFNVNNMELLQAICEAVADKNAPLILQISKGARQYANIKYLKAMIDVAVAEYPHLPIAVHCDHGDTFELIKECVEDGYTSVMIDGSHHPYEQNVELTHQVVEYAHQHDVTVEAELGKLGGVEEEVQGMDAQKLSEMLHTHMNDFIDGKWDAIPPEVIETFKNYLTDPDQAVDFVKKTGCDSLAVACGTSHGAYKFKHKPAIAHRLFDKIREKLPGFPLVMHGSSAVYREFTDLINQYGGDMPGAMGVPDEDLREAGQRGVCKVNIDTDLRMAMTAKIREVYATKPGEFDPRKYLGPARDAVREMVKHKLDVLGCAGKAALCLKA